eukprot:Sdes_comp16040_c0_seq1m5243
MGRPLFPTLLLLIIFSCLVFSLDIAPDESDSYVELLTRRVNLRCAVNSMVKPCLEAAQMLYDYICFSNPISLQNFDRCRTLLQDINAIRDSCEDCISEI